VTAATSVRADVTIDHRAVGRLLTLVERGGPAADAVDRIVTPLTGRAHVVGITGPPGAGKSTLVSALIAEHRARGQRVGVVAVDPSSRRGGAVLGDRVRMSAHHGDAGVFVRSMASRGQLGGLAGASPRAVRVLDAAGFDVVLVETVGVGQLEIDIASEADTTVVVLPPNAGDDVQAIKAGLLEIGDVFVVNKSDLAGASATARQLAMRVRTDPNMGAWMPPIVRSVATDGTGVADVVDALQRHRAHVLAIGEATRGSPSEPDPPPPTRRHFHHATSWEELGFTRMANGVRFSHFTVDEDRAATTAPVVFYAEFEPGSVTLPHSHDCDYAEIILEGRQQVTRRWYEAGHIRIVSAGTVYGPLVAGPEGCKVLVVFKDSRWVGRPADPSAPGAAFFADVGVLHDASSPIGPR